MRRASRATGRRSAPRRVSEVYSASDRQFIVRLHREPLDPGLQLDRRCPQDLGNPALGLPANPGRFK